MASIGNGLVMRFLPVATVLEWTSVLDVIASICVVWWNIPFVSWNSLIICHWRFKFIFLVKEVDQVLRNINIILKLELSGKNQIFCIAKDETQCHKQLDALGLQIIWWIRALDERQEEVTDALHQEVPSQPFLFLSVHGARLNALSWLEQGLDDGENCIRITRQGTRQRVQQVEEHSLKRGFEAKLRVAVLKRLLRIRDQILHFCGALEAKKEVGASEKALGVELVLEQRSVPILAQHNVLV